MALNFSVKRLNLPYLQRDLTTDKRLISLIITKVKTKAKTKIITKAKAKAKGLKGLKRGKKIEFERRVI